jgi:hypothetical protein
LEQPRHIGGFETTAGRTHPLILVYADWNSAWFRYRWLFETFPFEDHVPLMVWNPYGVPLPEIVAGQHDEYLVQWARGLKYWTHDVVIAWAVEPNNGLSGNSWTGVANGGPAGGAASYVSAWRRIHDVFQREGATNVRWAWIAHYQDTVTGDYYDHYPVWSRPDTSWNHFANYYPGDTYVDSIGLLAVNNGDSEDGSTYWVPPLSFFDRVLTLAEQRYPAKPQLVVLTSVEDGTDPSRKAGWISEAYARLQRHPNVEYVIWQHAFGDSWPIDSSPAALSAYRAATASSYYADTLP